MHSTRNYHQLNNSAIRRPIIVQKILIKDNYELPSAPMINKEKSNKLDEEIAQVEHELKSELIKICGMLS
jgi:hypothetical protein